MVKIVTGKINSGKTTKIYALYHQNQSGDGFIQLKTMQNNKVYYYEMLHLKSHQKYKLAIHQDFYDEEFSNPFRFGPYVFNQDVFAQMETILESILNEKHTPIYIDEVGMLEINQMGYAKILKKLIKNKLDLIIAVKDCLVLDVVKTFKIGTYEIIGDVNV